MFIELLGLYRKNVTGSIFIGETELNKMMTE